MYRYAGLLVAGAVVVGALFVLEKVHPEFFEELRKVEIMCPNDFTRPYPLCRF